MDTSFFFFETLKDIYHIDENEDNTALDEQKTTDMFQNLNDELEKIPHSSELSSNKICFSGEAFLSHIEDHPFLRKGKEFSIIRTALNALRHSVCLLDRLCNFESILINHKLITLEEIKEKTQVQIENIAFLTDLFLKLASQVSHTDLAEVPNIDITYTKLNTNRWKAVNTTETIIISELFLDGIASLTSQDLGKIELNILDKIKNIKVHDKIIRKKNAFKPIGSIVSHASIYYQAKLHNAIRIGKHWTSMQPSLHPLEDSINDVYKLGDAAFFKVGKNIGNGNSCGIIEHLIWDLAVLMGMERQFVPTGETQICLNQNSLNLKEDNPQNNVVCGGIQPAQAGWTLDCYLYGDDDNFPVNKVEYPIKRKELISAILASIIMGMWDAHGANIIITEDGYIKFFDNTKSLPNSNGWIKRGEVLYSTFRTSLLELEESYIPLTDHEKRQMTKRIENFQEKMLLVKEYLYSKKGKSIVKSLPENWLNVDTSLSSMQERLDLMRAGLNTPEVTNLRDICVISNPGYKFSFALSVATILSKKLYLRPNNKKMSNVRCNKFRDLEYARLQRELFIHREIGFLPDSVKIEKLALAGFEISFLKKLSDQPSLNCEEMMNEIIDYINNLKYITQEEKGECIEKSKELLIEIKQKALIDNKDL